MRSSTSETNALCNTASAVSQFCRDRQLFTLRCSPFYFRASAPGPDITQTTKLIEPTPGSSATTHPESAYDSEPGGFREGEGDNGSGCSDNGNGGEEDQPPGFGDSS